MADYKGDETTGFQSPTQDYIEGVVDTLSSFLTTEPNDLVRPVHAKAMPVVLQSRDECEEWLSAPASAIAAIQARVLPTDALEILNDGEAEAFAGNYIK